MDDRLLRPTRLAILAFACTVLTLSTLFYALNPNEALRHASPRPAEKDCPVQAPTSCPPLAPPSDTSIELVESMAAYFERFPPAGSFGDQFGERGQRAVQLKAWISFAARLEGLARGRVEVAVERAALSVFPFLAHPPDDSPNPLRSLRERAPPDTRGIVIPTGSDNLRLACHLIGSLVYTHSTTLPIEIAYAGDTDLSQEDRDVINGLFPGARLRFLDVLSVFNDTTLGLADGGWAIKPFALLASEFSEVILVDADTVFVQRPEALFEQEGYVAKGALLFHDRLIDKGRYMGRDRWYKEQVVEPSDALRESLVWNEAYAEEEDSGVVAADKSRLGVWMGVMHAAWQNSKAVREEFTYKMMYGDKESWWLGLELTGGEYAFERHYGGVAGWFGDREGPIEEADLGNRTAGVCSFVIAHLDTDYRLLWYNGGLLKNKKADQETFLVPTHWMVNGTWDKGVTPAFSCMSGGLKGVLTEKERGVLEHAVVEARAVDAVVMPPAMEETVGNGTAVGAPWGNATAAKAPMGNSTVVDAPARETRTSEAAVAPVGVPVWDTESVDEPARETGAAEAVQVPVDVPAGGTKSVDEPLEEVTPADVPVEETSAPSAAGTPGPPVKGTKAADVPGEETRPGDAAES